MSVTLVVENGIAVVTLDNPPVNALGQEQRQGLLDAVQRLDADPAVDAVVLICAGRTFVAGADVREFGQPPRAPFLPDVIARIERAAKPWLAAIHGTALGGGLELALACRWRVALDSARLGLPEVTLGIVPGAGGTVRTTRLAGVETALDLATTGKPMAALRAQAAGLLDHLVTGTAQDLRGVAIDFARAALDAPWPLLACERPVQAPDEAFWLAQRARVARAARGAQAPLRALECVRSATEDGFDTALAHERATFVELRDSAEAAALRHVFFAERAAPRPAALRDISPRPVQGAGVIGGGTMGAGIAAALADAGLSVVMVERDADALAQGLGRIDALYARMQAQGRITAAEAGVRRGRVTGALEYAALAGADLVIEAVFEDIDVKRAVFAALGRHCRRDAVLATNTSYLDPRGFLLDLPQPERALGLHFFSPAQVMKLLEIIPLPQTAPEVLATGFALAQRLGKVPVQAGICDGFIGNRILKRYRAAAEDLVRAGLAVADIDRAMRDFGMAMGPFEAQDMGGLDIAWMQRKAARGRGEVVPQALADLLVEAGRKGQKAGAGWYDYRDGVAQASAHVAALLAPHVMPAPRPGVVDPAAMLVAAMADEGRAILAEGLARSAADIDLVLIHGYGFPRWRGGPMFLTGTTG
jgi:3-hydroxyacyl-CoA dehydrogenase